jgi:3-hydroxyacyl-CoA dehydrogenase/enoyl-CoA hydratase/3-hydroxybutyryl-CoA epimerase
MLFAEALETVKCFDEGVLTTVADANIGSIFGIGFPAWTDGVIQYINQYEGCLAGFVARSRQLAERYGDHFLPPESLVVQGREGRDLRVVAPCRVMKGPFRTDFVRKGPCVF